MPFTIYINFRLLKFHEALRLPIYCDYRTKIRIKKSKIYLSDRAKGTTFGVKFGFGGSKGIETHRNYIILDNSKLYLAGRATFMRGISLKIENSAVKIGNNFNINKNGKIFSRKEIIIGDDVMIGWDVTILDSDGHTIMGKAHKKKIYIGDKVWIGAEVLILKGSKIPQGSVVAARSLVNKDFTMNNSNLLLGGQPCRIIKEHVEWVDEQL